MDDAHHLAACSAVSATCLFESGRNLSLSPNLDHGVSRLLASVLANGTVLVTDVGRARAALVLHDPELRGDRHWVRSSILHIDNATRNGQTLAAATLGVAPLNASWAKFYVASNWSDPAEVPTLLGVVDFSPDTVLSRTVVGGEFLASLVWSAAAKTMRIVFSHVAVSGITRDAWVWSVSPYAPNPEAMRLRTATQAYNSSMIATLSGSDSGQVRYLLALHDETQVSIFEVNPDLAALGGEVVVPFDPTSEELAPSVFYRAPAGGSASSTKITAIDLFSENLGRFSDIMGHLTPVGAEVMYLTLGVSPVSGHAAEFAGEPRKENLESNLSFFIHTLDCS